MGERKDHMKVGGINDFRPALIDPEFSSNRLTIWAVAVAAGIVMKLDMSTVRTLADIIAKPPGFAGADGKGSLLLFLGLKGYG